MNLNFFKIQNILNFKNISGAGDGEKVVLTIQKKSAVILSDNFASAGKLKKALTMMGKKVEIISSAFEKEDNDENLKPFVESVCKFLMNKLDYIIFLPCSAIVKFDLNFFRAFDIVVNKTYDLMSLCDLLIQIGYNREEVVSEKGQFALRGEILDIFPLTEDNPIRVEFFDDLVEKIHYFDITNVKNIKDLDSISIYPCILKEGENCSVDLNENVFLDQPKQYDKEIDLLMQSYKVLSYFKESNYAKFDYIYNKCSIVFDDLNDLKTEYKIESLPFRNYLTDFLALKNDILSYSKMGLSVILFAGNKNFKQKLVEFCTENNLPFEDFEKNNEYSKGLYLSELDFPYSFSFLQQNLVGIGSENLFKHSLSNLPKSKHSVFYLPKLGDFVVHSFHGIGKCIKIERLKIADIERDYFVIEYKNNGVLYLPSEEASSLSAYVGSEQTPKLSLLGGAEFSRLKEKVKQSIKEMAFSLAQIYQERQNKKGVVFARDEFLEKQFADAFPYQLSVDQENAIFDIDKDMENGKIMDRLICGDVGFGKTEVAMRAIFKCVYNGKQATLLCPTTILSQQHYSTLQKRFAGFGINVEVINRFKSSAQIKDILKKTKDGKIDVLIGTHRLLSNDVAFNDLGLLVLDEEQRFGVEHKEKIKNCFRKVDVLTLSATPIPRTLNMSLSGIRDISVIETPPKDRLPIQTYVVEFDLQLLQDVLSREKARGGISFVIYNRVEKIEDFTHLLKNLLPNFNITFAHGQMNEKTLESIINKLYNNEIDILVSTTLIENGVDLAKANTMIVVDADKLGLSTLYQLRGRIGRSDRLSYAYLTYKKDKVLTEQSVKRLQALKEFSALGSGFKIAMRDLEIRGAGNIFGKQQHGHIAKVGYDMYIKLLDEEVKNIRGEKSLVKNNVKMEVAVDAFIDEEFIKSSEERISYYTKISELQSEKEMEELLQSINDAFGYVPLEIKNLCYLAYLRNLASNFSINKIRINSNYCEIYLIKQEKVVDEALAKQISKFHGKLSFGSDIKIIFEFNGNVIDKMKKLIEFFNSALKND